MDAMNRLQATALGLVAVATVACGPKVELKMAVEVLTKPEKAAVTYKGKKLGPAPVEIQIATYDDLQSIVAESSGLGVSEKRIRILSPEKAQLIYRFGNERSDLARELGVSKVLIFEYAEKVSFDSGKSELKPDALPILNKQADILKVYFPKSDVFVLGYTDSTGGDDYNLKLSLQRAQTVSDYLVARGLEKPRLKTRGFGKQFPVESNATGTGRGLNLRTEVVLPQ
jgi:outer membrane protein OmpA-like peptidoglycan-associated protein